MTSVPVFVLYLLAAVVAVLVGHFVYLVIKNGWGWGLAKLKAWWNAGKADLASIETRVTALELKVGIKPATAPKAAAPAAAAPAPAAPAAPAA